MPVPKRELFRAPEVCEMAQLQPYVLRSWEGEFPGLGKTSGGGPRVYTRSDVELVLHIKQLVFGEGLTLAGARRRLEEQALEGLVATAAVDDVLGDEARDRLRQVRSGLAEILALLSRDARGSSGPELELVAPPAADAAGIEPRSNRRSAVAADGRSETATPAAGKRRKVS